MEKVHAVLPGAFVISIMLSCQGVDACHLARFAGSTRGVDDVDGPPAQYLLWKDARSDADSPLM